jgi:hypothetical protein
MRADEVMTQVDEPAGNSGLLIGSPASSGCVQP